MYVIENVSYGSKQPSETIDYGDQIYINKNIRSVEKTDEQTGETVTEWLANADVYTPSEYIKHLKDEIKDLSEAILELDSGDDE